MDFDESLADNGTQAADKRDLMTEYVTSALYERILKNRTPKIGLAEKSASDSKDHIYLKSKFLPEFQDIETYKKNKPGKLEINGFEKVMAACLFMGETDYHCQNTGVARGHDGEIHAVKIDHGKTGMELYFSKDEESIMSSFLRNRKCFGYSEIAFEAGKFKEAVSEINSITDDEIDTLIQNRVHNLRKTGFKLNDEYQYYGVKLGTKIVNNNPEEGELGVAFNANKSVLSLTTKGKASINLDIDPSDGTMYYNYNGEIKHLPKDLTTSYIKNHPKEAHDKILEFTASIGYTKDEQKIRYDNLEKFYTEKLKQRKVIFQEMEETLDVISKIDGNESFKKGGWISEIYGEYGYEYDIKKNPIVLAIEKHLTIEGKDPIAWAVENGKKIEGKDPMVWDVENKQQDILNPLLSDSIDKGNEAYINKYIKAGGDLNIAIDDKGTTMLMKANQEGSNKIANIFKGDLNLASKAAKEVKVNEAENKARKESKGVISALKDALWGNSSAAKTKTIQNKETVYRGH